MSARNCLVHIYAFIDPSTMDLLNIATELHLVFMWDTMKAINYAKHHQHTPNVTSQVLQQYRS